MVHNHWFVGLRLQSVHCNNKYPLPTSIGSGLKRTRISRTRRASPEARRGVTEEKVGKTCVFEGGMKTRPETDALGRSGEKPRMPVRAVFRGREGVKLPPPPGVHSCFCQMSPPKWPTCRLAAPRPHNLLCLLRLALPVFPTRVPTSVGSDLLRIAALVDTSRV